MRKVIMVGCDLHDKTMLLKIATDCEEPEKRVIQNTATGRAKMIEMLRARAAAAAPRYAAAVEEIASLCGVGVLTALVFLTELGDLSRFANRRQLAAYLGLAPRSFESGNANDRKGHITHQGSSRVRKMLCQATWTRVRWDAQEQEAYGRIVAKNPKKKKIAVVASMRRLAVRMWHRGLACPPGMPSRAMILAGQAAP